MRRASFCCIGIALLTVGMNANATVFTFDTDPFFGTTALTTPGRQVVGGETFINFSIASDVFSLDSAVFDVDLPVHFGNDLAANLATGGLNVVVLRSFDNDANLATPFGAGNAADLIADRITSAGAGFFVYFNSGLDLARLVYSTDLSSNTADLKILFRMTNLAGQAGRDAFPSFTASNFAIIGAPVQVPEPPISSLLMTGIAMLLLGLTAARRQQRAL